MKGRLLILGVCGGLFVALARASAEEPSLAGRLREEVCFPSFHSAGSLTEPPQVEGLLAGSGAAAGCRCVPPQIIGGASVGLYRFGSNESTLPVNRLLSTVSGIPPSSALSLQRPKMP